MRKRFYYLKRKHNNNNKIKTEQHKIKAGTSERTSRVFEKRRVCFSVCLFIYSFGYFFIVCLFLRLPVYIVCLPARIFVSRFFVFIKIKESINQSINQNLHCSERGSGEYTKISTIHKDAIKTNMHLQEIASASIYIRLFLLSFSLFCMQLVNCKSVE